SIRDPPIAVRARRPPGSNLGSHRQPAAPPRQGGRMATVTITAPPLTRVVAAPSSEAGEHYRVGRETAVRAARFPAERRLNMRFFGGRTIEQLAFTHV